MGRYRLGKAFDMNLTPGGKQTSLQYDYSTGTDGEDRYRLYGMHWLSEVWGLILLEEKSAGWMVREFH